MACFSTYIIVTSLLCQLTVTAAPGTLKDVVGALGGSVTFTLNFTKKDSVSIAWTFKTFSLAAVAQDNVIVYQNHNKKRIVFSDGGYSMKLSQLKKTDSGVYRAEIHSTTLPSPFIQEYKLHVYETLSRPKVTMNLQDNKNGTCITNLICSTEQRGENVTYSWKVVGQEANGSHDGAILPISWRLGEKDKTFICVARNPISNSSSTPTLASNLCEDAVKNPDSSRIFLYILPMFILLGLLMVIIPLTMRTEKLKGPKENIKRVEEMPNSWPQFEENAEYDTISYIDKTNPEEDAANTLYSTVQIPRAVKNSSSLPEMLDIPRPLSFKNII